MKPKQNMLQICLLSLQFAVANSATMNSTPEVYVVEMRSYNPSSFSTAQWLGGGTISRTSVSPATVDFNLRLVYHSASRNIEAWYDPTASGSGWAKLDTISLTDFSPSLTSTGTFTLALLANTTYGPVSEGDIWVDDFCLTGNSALLRFAPDPVVSSGVFLGRLTGPPNASVILQSSSDLTNWTPIATNVLPAEGWPITRMIGTNCQQFFRAGFGP